MGAASAITLIDVMKIPARTVRKYIEDMKKEHENFLYHMQSYLPNFIKYLLII